MHHLYFVKVSKDCKNAEEAKDDATTALDANNFASDEGGYFSASRADWYVVGGRWSGELSKILLKKDFFKELKKRYPLPKKYGFYTDDFVKENADKFQALWEELGGMGHNPYARDHYRHEGFDDDAMKITLELLKAMKKYKDVEVFDAVNCVEYPVKKLTKNDIGYWLVVIDYHN